MAVTEKMIQDTESLSGLTTEQITSITTLSTNDEKTVIGNHSATLKTKYEADILDLSGIAKVQDEKAEVYMKRVFGGFKEMTASSSEHAANLKTQVDKVASLEASIAAGDGNEAMKKQVSDAHVKLANFQKAYAIDKKDWGTKESKYDADIQNMKVGSEFDSAAAKIEFKAGHSDHIQNILLSDARSKFNAMYTPDWEELPGGKKRMVLRDATGVVVPNEKNLLEPKTVHDVLLELLSSEIDTGNEQPGAGSGNPKQPGSGALDISGATTQVQADELITAHLAKRGIVRPSPEFSAEHTRLRGDLKVSELIMR